MLSPCKIPEEKTWEFRECFNWFDKDGDQKIQGSDLLIAIRSVGLFWTAAEIKQLSIEFPASRPVSFPEFLSVCSRKYGFVPDPSFIDKAFKTFDRNNNGLVILSDVQHVLASVGDKLTLEEFQELCLLSGIKYIGGSQTVDKTQFQSLFGNITTTTATTHQ